MLRSSPSSLRAAFVLAALAFLATSASAQLYRWTDEKGRVHVGDTPPPASAKRVEKRDAAVSAKPDPAAAQPYVLQQARTKYPVTLYGSPSCNEPCRLARAALNARGVPYAEISVWDPESNEKLKQVSGSNEVPVLTVGSTALKGFDKGSWDELLDSAGYPRAGVLPAGSQSAPAIPEGYVPPGEQKPAVAEPVAPKVQEKLGPYAPRNAD
jgi:glutaredoxin